MNYELREFTNYEWGTKYERVRKVTKSIIQDSNSFLSFLFFFEAAAHVLFISTCPAVAIARQSAFIGAKKFSSSLFILNIIPQSKMQLKIENTYPKHLQSPNSELPTKTISASTLAHQTVSHSDYSDTTNARMHPRAET